MDVRNFSRRELLVAALLMGFSASIIQVLLIREILTLCRGNELIIGMIFSSWFLGIYLGARVHSTEDRKTLMRRVLISLFLLPMLAAASVYTANLTQIFFPRPVGSFYSFSAEILLALVFTLPVSFFVGFFFPPLVYLVSDEARERSGGMVFYVESMGSFAGGAVFSFVLVELANPLAIAAGLMILALVFIFIRSKRWFLLLAVFPLIVIPWSDRLEMNIFAYVWNKTHTGTLIEYRRTKYQTVAVESSGSTVSVYGDGILMYTIPDRYDARGIFHLIQSLRRDHRRVLVMGSGPGSLLHNLLQTDIELHYFEPDPELWSILHPHVRSIYRHTDEKKLVLHRQDLKHFLKNSDERFDMIVSIPPRPENIMLNRFYTKEFYSLCKKHLNDRGICITALHGFSNYMSTDLRDYIASIYAAFTGEFPVHRHTTGETMYLIGTQDKDILSDGVDALTQRYAKTKPADKREFEKEIIENFSPDELKMFFEKSQMQYFERIIAPLTLTIDANQDLKPVAYWKNIVLTAYKEQSALYNIIRGFVFIPVIVLILSAAALWDIRRRHGTSSAVSGFLIYITGFVSISTMIILILLYQNFQGIVYYRISLINALFMLGLSLGGYCFTRTGYPGLVHVFAAIATTLILILVFANHEVLFPFWILLLAFSILCGAVFPLLFAADHGGDYYTRASVLDTMDHFGAIAGSLLTALFFVPFLGIQGTIIVNGILILPASVIGFISFRRS